MRPIRGEYFSAVEFDQAAEDMTLRDLVEYYKKIVKVGRASGTPTESEVRYVDQAFSVRVQEMADKEEVPSGWVMYMVSELARTEMAAAETAEAELGLNA